MNLWQALLEGLGQVLAFFFDLVPNYGVAIIMLTIAVKVATLPLTIKQTRSMRAMAGMQQKMSKLKPELDRLKQKFRDDRARLNEETMKLYQEQGINPWGGLAGCLPLVLQFPIFIGLFRVFNDCGAVVAKGKPCPSRSVGTKYLPADSALRAALIGGQAGFLGMHLAFSPLQAYAAVGLLASIPYFFLVLVMTATGWIQMKQTQGMQGPPQPGQNQMQTVSRLMVFMFPVFSLNFPIALTVYWTTNNLLTILQTWALIGRDGKSGLLAWWDNRGKSPTAGSARPTQAAQPAMGGTVDGDGQSGDGGDSRGGKHKGSGARKGRRRR